MPAQAPASSARTDLNIPKLNGKFSTIECHNVADHIRPSRKRLSNPASTSIGAFGRIIELRHDQPNRKVSISRLDEMFRQEVLAGDVVGKM